MELLFKILIVSVVLFLGKNWVFSHKRSLIKKTVVISLLIGVIFAQHINDHKITYPLANWSMYSSPYPAPFFNEYVLMNSDGEEFHYPFNLINRVNTRAFMSKIKNFNHVYPSDDEATDTEIDSEYLMVIKSLNKIYSKSFQNNKATIFEARGVYFQTAGFKYDSIQKNTFITLELE